MLDHVWMPMATFYTWFSKNQMFQPICLKFCIEMGKSSFVNIFLLKNS